METDDKKENAKQAYEKPRLRIIELAAEEVLATGCKAIGDIAPIGASPPCDFNSCAGIGS